MDNQLSPILILYSSRFGQSLKIAEQLAQTLEHLGYKCDVINLEIMLDPPKPLSNYEAVVITASIRYGHFHRQVAKFVGKYQKELTNMLDVFIPINLIARNPAKRTLERNSYTRKFLATNNWRPKIVEIMAGALLYPRYNFVDRLAILLIMKITKGETDTSKEYEYTDWKRIPLLAQQIADYLHQSSPKICEWNSNMLKEIENWILKNFDCNVKINCNDYTDSLVVEFEDEKKIARFVLWDDKSCVSEIIDVNTEKYLINERRELDNSLDIMNSFRKFVDLLKP